MTNNGLPHGWSRRQFLASTAAATLASALPLDLRGEEKSVARDALIDTNISLSHWPTRRVYGDDIAELVEVLRAGGVQRAWVGHLDAILHKNLAAVNSRLAASCAGEGKGLLVPFGAVNPNAPDWEEDFRRCAEEYRMGGVRLHPNYHRYGVDDPRLDRLLRMAAERKLVVQLAVVMEDERMMHPLMKVEPVNVKGLAATVKAIPGLRLVLLNALRTVRGEGLQELMNAGDVYCEISMLEGIGGVGKLVKEIPVERVLFGSHAPMFYFQAALLKLKESVLSAEQLVGIQTANARRLLA